MHDISRISDSLISTSHSIRYEIIDDKFHDFDFNWNFHEWISAESLLSVQQRYVIANSTYICFANMFSKTETINRATYHKYLKKSDWLYYP